MYDVTPHWNHLFEMILINGSQHIYFYGEIKVIISELSSNIHLIRALVYAANATTFIFWRNKKEINSNVIYAASP